MTLKFVAAKRPAAMPVVLVKRNKLVRAIWEQIQLAQAVAEGKAYAPIVNRSKRNADGIKVAVPVPKRVRSWVWTGDDGKTYISLRYGARELALPKGANAVAVEDGSVVAVLEELKAMAEQGAFDDAIAAIAPSPKLEVVQ
jgi:hypothetical protein